MRDPSDASEVLRLIDDGLIAPHEIVAILGKTEGNGCVNDFSRGYATMALSAALAKPLGITAEEVPSRVAIVMSGGTEGGLSPHFLVFAVRDRAAGAQWRQIPCNRRSVDPSAVARADRPHAASGVDGGRGS